MGVHDISSNVTRMKDLDCETKETFLENSTYNLLSSKTMLNLKAYMTIGVDRSILRNIIFDVCSNTTKDL